MKDFDYMALAIKCMLLFMFARMFLFVVGVDL
jgi:hypothetical protein